MVPLSLSHGRRRASRPPSRLSLALLVCVLLLGFNFRTAVAEAAPPDNDAFAAATAIAALPFAASIDLSDATTEPSAPFGCASYVGDVWFRLTAPANQSVRVTLSAPDSQLWAAAYRDSGGGTSGLQPINQCIYAGQPSTLTLTAGDSYYLQVNRGFSATLLTATLTIELIAPPANDNFADAARFSTLPHRDNADSSAATAEAGEPILCTPPASEKTVWYAFTPSSSGSVVATIGAPEPYGIAVYVGSSLNALSSLDCHYGYPLALHVQAGTTYYFQLGLSGGRGSQLQFNLDVAPPPLASFYSYPLDPSAFDLVSFASASYDPAASPLAERWDFGDGSVGTGTYPQHRYRADGDYTVTLTVTSADGRHASATQVVSVRTHDVAVLGFDVPRSAKAGKTATITVAVGNTRYAEAVQVRLLKSVAGGSWEQVGELVNQVPVMKPKKTASFALSYRFTAEDAAAGKVTFQAAAYLVGGPRDASPNDNTVIAPPTIVTR
jgi:PKD repeat protein